MKVIYEKRGAVAYITLNRPDKHNAIDLETDALLAEAWSALATDDEVRVAILHANGKNFCAGADLADHSEGCWVTRSRQTGVTR
jgi:enoyl-CoA hydratase/carnithine racemase